MMAFICLIKLVVLLSAIVDQGQTACSGNNVLCNSGECIYNGFQCDTEYDCQDQSDEQYCVVNTVDSCGGKINATSPTSGFISSPNYPSDYPTNATCTWIIQGPPDTKITLRSTDFDLQNPETRESTKICHDWLTTFEKKSGDLQDDAGEIYCGDHAIKRYQSTGNYLWIQFRSDGSRSNKGFNITYSTACSGNDILCNNGECVYYGFQCDTEYDCQDQSDEQNCVVNTVDSCGGKINATSPTSGFISSPNYPSDYPADTTCTWIISGLF
ncbi:low-density lipoprotein receptor-related protein 12-like [Amphiura filiformis]|uniref:low-density lipoprotein receptor-related protein 12-like n=1 Tax=Amphiura filiformis TaxID=82378 RepID=UPI003B222536